MKKALLYGLSAVMLVSLTACGTAQANQPDEPPPTPTPSAVQTEPPQETPAPENTVEPLSVNGDTLQELTQSQLEEFFESGYQAGLIYADIGVEGEELLTLEENSARTILEVRGDLKIPDDFEEQYRAWRASAHPSPLPQQTGGVTTNTQRPTGNTGGTQTPAPSNNGSLGAPSAAPGSGTDASQFVIGLDDIDQDAYSNSGMQPIDPSHIIYGN